MTAGKSKRVPKGKKTGKQKIDPYAKKEWYDVKSPAPFKNAVFAKTPINKSTGLKISTELLKGRVFEVSMGDLSETAEAASQIVRLRVEEVRGKTAYTVFHGLRFATDKLRGLLKKWVSLVQANVDVKTSDGYILRVFVMGTTKKRGKHQLKKTTYANASQIAKMRWRMKEMLIKSFAELDVNKLVSALQTNAIGTRIEKSCSAIFPLQNVNVYKVKVIKAPKYDSAKMGTLYSELGSGAAAQDVGAPVEETQEAAQ